MSLGLGSLGVILGALVIWIGTTTVVNRPSVDEQLSALSFGVWWLAAGTSTLIRGSVEMADVMWRADYALHLTVVDINIFLSCLALFSLTHFLVYLLAGTQRLWIPLAFFYGIAAFYLIFIINYQRPIGLDIAGGRVGLAFQEPLAADIMRRLFALLAIPPALGLIGYLFLYNRLPFMIQKWRLVASTILILVMFVTTVSTSVYEIHRLTILPMVVRLIGLPAAVLLLFTYYPPAPLKRRLEASF